MLTISLVQQGAWDTPLASMPLACGYLKATVDSHPRLAGEAATRITNFQGRTPQAAMVRELFQDGTPDVLAFSVLGWNYRAFGSLARTFKQLNPRGTVVFGGNHVANQATRVFREIPEVNIVVNGEGELTFPEIILCLLDQPAEPDLATVADISFRDPDGAQRDTPERARINDLDTIPSPFLTGAIPMTNADGQFPYDVALMETNRGCPYKCSFCYWGGAIGQRVRSFSRERLAAELEFFGAHQVQTLVLCDANFGMLEADEEFVEDLIRTKERFGYPRALETSWAKNKSSRFFHIVSELQRHGFQSSFTLALQTLSDAALTGMQRRNMRVNQWEDMADWLTAKGLDCYAELIWGAPGETPQSFYEGYDSLASRVSRIAVYPLLLLPNTAFQQAADANGFVTIRGDHDDFEYVVANQNATLAEHLDMQQFLFWARLLGENRFLNHVLRPTRALTGLTQSQVFNSVRAAFDESTDREVVKFLRERPVIANSPAIAHALRQLYSEPALEQVIGRWWAEQVVPMFPEPWRTFAQELYRYEQWCRPVYVAPGNPSPAGWRLVEADGIAEYRSDPVCFSVDVLAVLASWPDALSVGLPAEEGVMYEFRALAGFYYRIDNHETGVHHAAKGIRWPELSLPSR
jgi:radical SAM superfamily enzyme YgiQ (UPF0313 family)